MAQHGVALVTLRRWLPYGAIAIAAHVAAMAAMLAAPRGPQRGSLTPRPEVEVELVPSAEAIAPKVEGTVAPSSMSPPTAAPDGRLAMRGTGTLPSPGPQVPETAVEPAPAPAGSGGWTFNAAPPPDILAAGAVARAVQETVPPAEVPTTLSPSGGVAEGLDAHDAAIGLGRGGPVASALEAATYAEASADGKATFDVSIDTSGHVSVSLVGASATADAWTRVARSMASSMDAKRVRIPPGAKGWRVVATVESKVQYPNGADPKKMGTRLEAAGPELVENKNRQTARDPPIVFKKPPGLTLAHSGKVCSVSVHLGLGPLISGGCDPSNIGAHETRVVHSYVVSEGRL